MTHYVVGGTYKSGEKISVPEDLKPGAYAFGKLEIHVVKTPKMTFGVVRKGGVLKENDTLRFIGGIDDVLD